MTKKTAVSSLPLSWYFDEQIYAREKQQLFTNASQYIGHYARIPQPGDYVVLGGEKRNLF